MRTHPGPSFIGDPLGLNGLPVPGSQDLSPGLDNASLHITHVSVLVGSLLDSLIVPGILGVIGRWLFRHRRQYQDRAA